ncbi:MAG: hypothetical protein IJI14_04850 [Anaerolineaceae bacterium]|nr:hypothetical protein [Anaerolineaceae bacterium]
MKKNLIFIVTAIFAILIMTACSKKSDSSEAAKPVEAFYNAIVTQNRDRVSSIACAEWEKDALREVDAFMGVKSELKDFSCTVSEPGESEAIVTCKGAIAASYGTEITNFPLDNRSHKVIKQQGEWRICGY